MEFTIIYIILLTFFPTLELRASIPYALTLAKFDLWIIPVIITLNILLGEIIFYLLNTSLPFFLKIKIFNKIYNKCVIKIQKKARPWVKKYGVVGLATFIGIPLPGSGVYSGALAAFIFGLKRKDFTKANTMGVTIAGIIVSLIVLLGISIIKF
ncbi:MAG TPA: hypothetical protein EYP80_02670 [Candidatus Aenigmarchaeota archaeon]|nr:hypothetical protein [Candidatus Aenigmarchaeota archaeon]